MKIDFVKLVATGNDFIAIDNRLNILSDKNASLFKRLCCRHQGIGADGVLLFEKAKKHMFKMEYYNADGSVAKMCGNGARAIIYFAQKLGVLKGQGDVSFLVYDREYQAKISNNMIAVYLNNIVEHKNENLADLYPQGEIFFIDSGVPHIVVRVLDVDAIDVEYHGKKIRDDNRFKDGSNVNFFQFLSANKIKVRTYERGVEGETLSCGTGVVACAWIANILMPQDSFEVLTKGGDLSVVIDKNSTKALLAGSVKEVFYGTINIDQFID